MAEIIWDGEIIISEIRGYGDNVQVFLGTSRLIRLSVNKRWRDREEAHSSQISKNKGVNGQTPSVAVTEISGMRNKNGQVFFYL